MTECVGEDAEGKPIYANWYFPAGWMAAEAQADEALRAEIDRRNAEWEQMVRECEGQPDIPLESQ